MAIEDVTPAYVDLLSYNKYASRTANSTEFAALKDMYCVYLNTSTGAVPDKKFTHALSLLICHHYVMDDTQTPDEGGDDEMTGPVTSESVGDVSIGYGGTPSMGSVDGWKAWLNLSRYGSEFIYLMKTFKSTPLVT